MKRATSLLTVLVLSIVSTAFGQQPPAAYDPAALAKLIAPYLSEDVVMIAHLELARLDMDTSSSATS